MKKQLKALIYRLGTIASQLLVTNFILKAHKNFTGYFPNYDWLCHPWPPFSTISCKQEVAKGGKGNHGWENPCKIVVCL